VAGGQLALYAEASSALRGQTYWLARRMAKGEAGVQTLIDVYQPAADALRAEGPALFSPLDQAAVQARAQAAVAEGAPAELATRVAVLGPLLSLSDIADLARAAGWAVLPAARVYHAAGASFAFDRLRAAAVRLLSGDVYQRQAARQMMEDLLAEQALLTRAVMAGAERDAGLDDPRAARDVVEAWAGQRQAQADGARRLVQEIEASGGEWSFAKLTIANTALRALAAGAG
jgi:glutamate dehydrogenase